MSNPKSALLILAILLFVGLGYFMPENDLVIEKLPRCDFVVDELSEVLQWPNLRQLLLMEVMQTRNAFII